MRATSCLATAMLVLALGSVADARAAQDNSGICSFEKNACGWKSSGRKKWVRGAATPSGSTGAGVAHKGTYFMYLETSSPSAAGWTSYMTHKVLSGYKYVNFYYHMHGSTMGTLRLQAQVSGKWRNVWSKSGQQQKFQGDAWRKANARPSVPPPRSISPAPACDP